MLERYKRPVNEIEGRVRDDVLRYFGLEFWVQEPRIKLFGILTNRGISQADLVLALLRLNHLRDAERVVGKPIKVCPPCLRPAPMKVQRMLREAKVVKILVDNPCIGFARQKFDLYRPGMSVSQLILRGLRRRDLLKAQRWHWIQFSEQL